MAGKQSKRCDHTQQQQQHSVEAQLSNARSQRQRRSLPQLCMYAYKTLVVSVRSVQVSKYVAAIFVRTSNICSRYVAVNGV